MPDKPKKAEPPQPPQPPQAPPGEQKPPHEEEFVAGRSAHLLRRRHEGAPAPALEKPSRTEDEYFARRDAELLRQQREAAQRQAVEQERKSHYMKCPKCGYDLITGEWHGVQVDQCTHCHGIWFDAGEAEAVVSHAEPNIIARVFRAVMRGVSGQRVPNP